jgi:hypothetical protein
MSKPITDELRLYFNTQRDSTIRLLGAYGDKLTAEQKQYVDLEFKSVKDRLDKLDVINDSDGMKTAVESIIELQKLLSEDGSLKDVLGNLKGINDTLVLLEKRITDTEVVANRADGVSATNAQNITKLKENLTQYNSDLSKKIEDGLTANKKYTDDELVKIRAEIKSAVDEGGQAVVDLKKRAKILENSLFDTEVDGVIVKGIATRLAESETTIKQNAELAKRQAEDAETNSKKYVDENFIDISDIKAVKDDIPTNENKAREALGLEPIEIG